MLRVTVLELPATWGAPLIALDAGLAELESGPATDLVLLPEASLTGYVSGDGDFDLARFAEPIDGSTARAIAGAARRLGTIIVAPLVLREGAARFNAMVAFDRHGERLFVYRKRHPWFPETWATPGSEAPPIVTIAGLRVTIAICFDVHFLEDEAASSLDAADLLLFPTAWVDEHDSRSAVLVELASRHGIAIANANWGVGVVRIPGQGGSEIIGPRGEVLARVAPSGRARADATVEISRGASPR